MKSSANSIEFFKIILVIVIPLSLPLLVTAQSKAERDAALARCTAVGGHWVFPSGGGNPTCVIPPKPTNQASPNDTKPADPTQAALDARAAQREKERKQKEADDKARQQAAEDATKAADFLKKRDEAAGELKGLGSDDKSELKEIGTKPAESDPCPPSKDPMIVEACHVPSNLSRNVVDAIEGAFKGSSPEVIVRVRKAFQAVQEQDWPVVVAWLKDALYHDPTNDLLRRLITAASSPRPNRYATVPAALRTHITDEAEVAKAFSNGIQYSPELGTRPMDEKLLAASFDAAVKLKSLDRYYFGTGDRIFLVPDDYVGSVRTYIPTRPGKFSSSFIPLPVQKDVLGLMPGADTVWKRAPVTIYYIDEFGLESELPADYHGGLSIFAKGERGKIIAVPRNADGTFNYSQFTVKERSQPN